MYNSFTSKYCYVPVNHKPKVIPLTEEDIINNFTKYIENKCVNENTLIQYSMPEEFKDRIERPEFFRIICHFIDYIMKFEVYDPGLGKMDQIYDSTYESLEYGEYYCIAELPNTYYPGYFQEFSCLDLCKITKVVLRIYKA
jgi:hypothetical protein